MVPVSAALVRPDWLLGFACLVDLRQPTLRQSVPAPSNCASNWSWSADPHTGNKKALVHKGVIVLGVEKRQAHRRALPGVMYSASVRQCCGVLATDGTC